MLGKAETFEYDDARRLAHLHDESADRRPAQGDITANRVELFLKPAGTNELERAEAYAKGQKDGRGQGGPAHGKRQPPHLHRGRRTVPDDRNAR